MSAFMCDADTFDYLATFASVQQHSSVYRLRGAIDLSLLVKTEILIEPCADELRASDAATIAAVLRRANALSVIARYGEKATDMLDPELYTFRYVPPEAVLAVEVLKSIACLRYQSCEVSYYDQTAGGLLLAQIEQDAIAALPGYGPAPWGWTRAQLPAGRCAEVYRII